MRLQCVVKNKIDWDAELTTSSKNPFPLAPRDLQDRGLVTPENYRVQNRRLTRFCTQTMMSELKVVVAGTRMQIAGFGIGRDVQQWLPRAVREFGCSVDILDTSEVACENARRFLRYHGLVRRVKVAHADVEEYWSVGEVPEVVFIGQGFIQTQDDTTKDRMLGYLGTSLPEDGVVYLLHARGEDNPRSRVRWGKSTPYTDTEIRAPLEEGAGGQVVMQVLGKHQYYHQKYTLLRIGRA